MSAPDETDEWAIGGGDSPCIDTEYAIEPTPGGCARNHTDELGAAIEDLPDYRHGARIIRRTVLYGAWEYVPAEEL